MATDLEVLVRSGLGTHRATGSRGGGLSARARSGRAMNHALVRFVACAVWLIARASIVTWPIGYPLER